MLKINLVEPVGVAIILSMKKVRAWTIVLQRGEWKTQLRKLAKDAKDGSKSEKIYGKYGNDMDVKQNFYGLLNNFWN